jgi:hypothetical protein
MRDFIILATTVLLTVTIVVLGILRVAWIWLAGAVVGRMRRRSGSGGISTG